MFTSRVLRAAIAGGLLLCAGLRPAVLTAQTNATTPGAMRTYATINSIGVEWTIAGDADHDANVAVEFRVAGTTAWRPAMPLVRVDYKNNLWVSASGGRIFDFGSTLKDWRSDFDNDGFDWGSSTTPFRYGGVLYANLAAFATASGLETHGRQISRAACFATFNVPGPAPVPIPPQLLTLKAGCNAVDAGVVLPNINDGFVGAAPDLGAFELGIPAPSYGRRLGPVPQPPTNLRITVQH